jgi:hypothetical protein
VSNLSVNTITNAAGANTAQINGMTPTADSLQGFRNRIINGDMRIDQRNAGASVTFNSSALVFPVDRFGGFEDTDGVMTGQQDSSAPPGFTNSVKVTTTTADASLGAAQFAIFRHNIEGTNFSDLGWGTANAQTVTFSFWTRSSLTGTVGGAVMNSAQNRAYPFSYAINAVNTWEYKTITIPGDTTGAWLTNNGTGLQINFGLGVGSTYSGTAGAWAGAPVFAPTGAVSVIGTLNATWQVTGVQLEAGSVAMPFERRDYGRELALCQRYFQQLAGNSATIHAWSMWNVDTTSASSYVFFPMAMRASPTCTVVGTPQNTSGGAVANDKWSIYSSSWRGCNAINLNTHSQTGVRLDANPVNSITGGGACGLYGGNQCNLTFSAEL